MADETLPTVGFIERVLQLNPFDPRKFARDLVPYKPGATLQEYVAGMTGPDIAVSVNGKIVPEENYGKLVLCVEDQIVLKPIPTGGGGAGGGGGTGKMIFRMLAMVALAVVAILVPVLIPGLAPFAAALIGGGIMLVGGLIINAFTPTPHQANNTAGSDSPSYGWDGPQMTAHQGLKIGIGIGTFRPAPNVIASWTFERNNQEWMNVLLCCGHGPGRAISSILINSNKAENYRGVTIEKRLGYNEQATSSQFHRLINEYPVGIKLTVAGGSYTYTGHRTDTTGLELQFQFPKGLWKGPDANGNYSSWTVWTKIEYRLVGGPTWNTLATPRTTTPVDGTPYWVAISTDDVQGGPNDVVVHATSPNAGDHYAGEPYSASGSFSIFDDTGALYSTETRTKNGVWQRNPNAPLGLNGGIGGGGGGITPVGGGAIVQTVNTWSTQTVPATGIGGHDNAQRVVRITAFINNLPPGQYECRVSKIGSGSSPSSITHADNNGSDVGEDEFFFSVREVTNDDLTYPTMITCAVKALATDQLSGSGLNVSPLVDYGDPITLGYKHLVAADRPQLYFRFDELAGTVCSDQSGRGNNGTYSATGVTLQKATLINQSTSKAVGLDGAGTTKVTIPAMNLKQSWAIDCWIKPTALAGFIAGAAGDPVQVGIDATGKLNVIWSATNHLSATALVAGTAYHVAVVCDAGKIFFIVNGAIDANTYTAAPAFTNCTEVLRAINGVVDEFCIYAPTILRPNFMRRYQWGISKHNILDDYTGNNPACAVWNLMTNPDYGAGAPDGVTGGITFAQMDAVAFKKWADYCNQVVSDGRGGTMFRHTTNAFIEADDNLWSVVSKIASCTHATVMQTGVGYTVALDAPYDTIKQMFSVANIKEGSYKRTWLGLTDRATQLDVVFMDELDNYKRTPMTVTLDSAIQAGTLPRKGATLELFGVTSQAEAWRMATYKLLQNQKLFQTVEFQADIDAITCGLGDVIKLQHDVPQWGAAGRCVAGGTVSNILLDIPVTIVGGHSYEIMLVHSNLSQGTGTGGTAISSVVGQIVNLPGYTGNTVKRLVCNGATIDRKVVAYGAGFVQLDDVTGIAAGQDWTVYDTDVLETRAVSTGAGTVTAVAVTTPFSAAPSEFQMWLFGEVGNNAQLFRVTELGRTADLERRIKAIQYDGTVYTDLEPVTQASKSNSPYYGPVLPAAAANVATSGTRAWANPASALTSDGAVAQAVNSAAGVTETSQFLLLTNFNPKLQPADVPSGIRLEIEEFAVVDGTGTGFVQDVSLQLMLNGSPIGTPKSIGSHWNVLKNFASYGGDGDMWGTTGLLNTDINDASFGARLQVTINTPVGKTITQANVDSARMTVFVAKAPRAAVSNLQVTEIFQRDTTKGAYYPVVQVAWTKGDKTYGAKVFVSEQVPGAPFFGPPVLKQQVPGATHYSFIAMDGASYKVQVVGFDTNGNDAPYYSAPSATITVVGANQLPADVSNFRIASWATPNVVFNWNANTEPTLAGYEIRYKASTTAGILEWDSASVVASPAAGATSQALSNGNGTYFIKAKLTAGYYSMNPVKIIVNSNSSPTNGQGSILPATGTSGPFGFFSSDAGGILPSPTAVLNWIVITQYRPDGTNFPVPASSALWPHQPDPPILTSVAGGAKAAATAHARCAYVKDGAIVGFGESNSLAVPINSLLKVPSPVITHPTSSAVWASDSFTDTAGVLLENHVQDVSNGKRWLKDVGTSLKINAGGNKLTIGASGIARYVLQDHPWKDGYTIQMDIDMSTSTLSTDEEGCVFQYRDTNNFYYVFVQGNGSIRVNKCVGGAFTALNTTVAGAKTGTLKVVSTMTSATNTLIQVYWNNVLIITVNDTALPCPNAYGARVGIMTNTPTLANTIDNFSVTDSIAPPALAVDGWVPIVGTAVNNMWAQVDPRTPIALGTDWTEAAGPARWPSTLGGPPLAFSAATINTQFATFSGAKAWLNMLASVALGYNLSTVFYPTTDNIGSAPGFGSGSGPNQPGTLALQSELFLDGRYALCGSSGVSFTSQSAPAGGSGGGVGGGGCSRKDMVIKPIGHTAFGVDFFNEDWIEVECENGCSKVATPRDRVLSYDHGVLELQDWLVREGLTLITELGKSPIKRVRKFKETGVAVNLQMNEGHLYWAGKETGKGILSSNLKP